MGVVIRPALSRRRAGLGASRKEVDRPRRRIAAGIGSD
jgi:hypothetical protein